MRTIESVEIDGTPVSLIGERALLSQPRCALLCSRRCPGEIILGVYGMFKALRSGRFATVSGFHSPMEKECLRLLLRNRQPAVYCPARGIARMRIPKEMKPAIEAGRLAIVSPFDAGVVRATAATAARRNRFAADIADAVFMPYADPGGNTEALCRELLAEGRAVYTIDSGYNERLTGFGCRAIASLDEIELQPDGGINRTTLGT